MHKLKLIASIFVIVLVVASLLLVGHLGGLESNGSPIDDASFEKQQPDESPVYNESLDEQLSGVKIASFEVAGWYTGPVFPKIGYQYNLTIATMRTPE